VKTPGRTTWLWLMLVILLTNGMGAFGLKILASWNLPAAVKFPYLTVWYAAGIPLISIPMFLGGKRGGLKEVCWGALFAVLSLGGQLAMAHALELGVPGSVVFPVAVGGSILVVALAGRLFFRERMHLLSWAGVAIGILAVALLSAS
jgi:multidrug transporter EmrE-like cation transporter